MKQLTVAVSVLFTLLCSACNSTAQPSAPMPVKPAAGFAVIELFTSEGCSSCPAADRTAAQLTEAYKDQPVLFLEEHVDYWDRLGWKDPFSQKAFTDRQYAYATQMGGNNVYTPQAIVNGQIQMVGSEKAALQAAIDKSLSTAATGSITLKAENKTANSVTLNYTTSNNDAKVILILVQKNTATDVPRGENSGRHLPHINVVRSIITEIATTGTATLNIPAGLNETECFIAAIAQSKSGAITAMATSPL